jgi:hypothetical protein|tara:strand:+ start:7774 stop:7977 length:204 start_codon:yes stop_codon:yes gene_type:complete
MAQWHGGKGDGRRNKDDQKAYSDNYDKIFGKKDLTTWSHYCIIDRTLMSNLKGEPCNWCEAKEDETK